MDAEDHLPRPALLGPPRAAADLAVVLPDATPRVHREPASQRERKFQAMDRPKMSETQTRPNGIEITRCRCGLCGEG